MSPVPYLAPSLATFRNSINIAFPYRDKSSDGWIGDAAHQTRQSEHNPDSKGCVHAIDVDVDDNDVQWDLRQMILDECIGHPAVWYVISNGKIYSRTYNWTERVYTGSNLHEKHVHISIRLTADAENDKTLILRKVRLMPNATDLQEVIPNVKDIDGSEVTKGEIYYRSLYSYYAAIGKLEEYKAANPNIFGKG